MNFVVIDVETANQHAGSICQIGIASFRSGRLSGLWGSLVNPGESFSAFHQSIHGIRQEHVIDAPNWMEVQSKSARVWSGERSPVTLTSISEPSRVRMSGMALRVFLAAVGWIRAGLPVLPGPISPVINSRLWHGSSESLIRRTMRPKTRDARGRYSFWLLTPPVARWKSCSERKAHPSTTNRDEGKKAQY